MTNSNRIYLTERGYTLKPPVIYPASYLEIDKILKPHLKGDYYSVSPKVYKQVMKLYGATWNPLVAQAMYHPLNGLPVLYETP